MTSESAVNFANVSDDNRQEEKAEKPVAERRQRRDLRKRVRIDDNVNNVNENAIEAVEVPVVETVQNEVVENNVADNIEDKPRQERQRRTPRHLRTSNNQRRRRNEVKSPMPLFAAVASPELASGKYASIILL